MTYHTQELVEKFAELITSIHGDHREFTDIVGYESITVDGLVFLQDATQLSETQTIMPAVIVTTESISDDINAYFPNFTVCVSDVKLAQAKIKQYYCDYKSDDQEWQPIHNSAIIHNTAEIGTNCRIGPNVIIGANCDIGDNVIIRTNCTIEHGVKIGKNSVINALANIGYNSQLGERVIVQSGCIIGNEGYGFATDKKNHHHRIPHTGNVIIGNDVHIGSNTCIDRGTYGSTKIGGGVKIDNLCHIAHNVNIGENSLITAQCVIAGSSTIGKRVIMSGQTGVLDHMTIADDAILVHRAGVSKDIPHAGVWAGTPVKPLKEYIRDLSLNKKVIRLEKQIKELKKLISDR